VTGGAPGLNLTEIAQRPRLPRSTTHSLLGQVVDYRLLDCHGAVYSLCLRLRDLIGRHHLAAVVRSQVSRVLEDLDITSGLRSRFEVWTERGVSWLERPADRWRARCTAGLMTLPLHATAMGKMIFAHAPPAAVQQVAGSLPPPDTLRTLSSARQQHHALAASRRCGLAVAREELREGECASAVLPVFGPQGGVAAALEPATATSMEALPPGSRSDPLRWRADPTSAELSWCGPEAV
jgi:DNA-binding IclR family transcriptional regulator